MSRLTLSCLAKRDDVGKWKTRSARFSLCARASHRSVHAVHWRLRAHSPEETRAETGGGYESPAPSALRRRADVLADRIARRHRAARLGVRERAGLALDG